MKKTKALIIIGTEGAILGPTLMWFFCQIYYGYISVDQFIQTLMPPKLWMLYVAGYALVLFLYMNKKLNIISEYLENPQPQNLNRVQKSISSIPRFFMIAVIIFCTAGPSTYIVPESFYTKTEFLLSELLAFAFIFSFAVPWFVYTMMKLEKWVSGIPLSKEHGFLSLKAKLAVNMLATSFGTAVILVILNLSIPVTWSGTISLIQLQGILIQKNIVMGILCIVIILLNFFMLSAQIIVPLGKITTMLKDISEGEGDLTRRLETSSRDDVGELVKWFNFFVGNISSMIGIVRKNADKVKISTGQLNETYGNIAASSEEVVKTIQDISKGASSQAEELDEVNSMLNDFSREMEKMYRTMGSIASKAQATTSLADRESAELQSIAGSIYNIGISFNSVKGKISELGENIKQINNITDMIKGVADQTNMLALNAAIEAARAGETGRGFAIVAEEIRKLAEQTKISSESIKQLVGKVSLDAEVTVSTADRVNSELNGQLSVIKVTLSSFTDIINAINEISPQIEDVTKLVNDVNEKKSYIIKKVDEVSEFAQNTSSSSQQIAAASEEMNASMEQGYTASQAIDNLAVNLYEQVKRFKV